MREVAQECELVVHTTGITEVDVCLHIIGFVKESHQYDCVCSVYGEKFYVASVHKHATACQRKPCNIGMCAICPGELLISQTQQRCFH